MTETDKGNRAAIARVYKRLVNMHISRVVDVEAWKGALDESVFVESVSIQPETTDENLQKGIHKVEMRKE